MKKTFKKLTSLAVAATMAAGLLSGCGGTAAPSSNPDGAPDGSSAASDNKEITKLVWYMSLNPVAPDTDKVIEELNKYTREKIGVEVDYKCIANPDYREKMPNLINAGEYFDICFTANWSTNYRQFAQKDAFLDISELLPEYAKETYEFIPDDYWKAVTVDGGIYGVPSYKEMGGQGGILYNSDMAEKYELDMSKVKSLEDYTEILKELSEKTKAEKKEVIGMAGSHVGWRNAYPAEAISGNMQMPVAVAVPEMNNFKDMEGQTVFNPYASQDYMDYCKLMRQWNQAGYLGGDPVNYNTDIANRDNDFNNGTLFSYIITYAPGTAESMTKTCGHGVGYIPLSDPLFQTDNAMGGLLAISSASEHPEKALELINLLNTDKYVGTLMRHGIEGVHHSAVGDNQVDKTMGGTLTDNGYDYTYGWQFGTPFNQKWDISYPDNIADMFKEYNASAVTAPHVGFSFNQIPVEGQIAALSNVVAEYEPALESGAVDPEQYIPEFLKALDANGAKELQAEVEKQLAEFNK